MNGMIPTGLLAIACLAGCAAPPAADEMPPSCAALQGRTIAASRIGLPSGDATVATAQWQAATGAAPGYCKVLGSIAPRTKSAQAIHFELNMPAAWNGKALQYGGGGFNGTLVTGLAPLRDAAPTDPLPIARGYATLGTDSGHQAASFPASEPGAFALDDEMLENFAFASYKKVHDVGAALIRDFYRRDARRFYYFGGSEGGREGLTMAQRFPDDYDGIVSVVPVIGWTGLFHAFVRNEVPQFDDWLDAAKVPMVAKATSDACDALDGLVDGVVNNYQACQGKVDLSPLRCAQGVDSGPTCLSDRELAVLRSLHQPYVFAFPLANGVMVYPGWLWGHEDSLDGAGAPSMVRWVTGSAAPTVPPNAQTAATQWLYGSNWIRYAIARSPGFDVRAYRPQDMRERVQATSALMDSTDPDLSRFFARGGKLIIRENAGDRAQSALMGIGYYRKLVELFGAERVEGAVRLYVSPASTHTGNARSVTTRQAVPTMVDLLDPLDRWVVEGAAPADPLIQTRHEDAAPFAITGSRPLCRWPRYPHHVGGDANSAASYECQLAR